MRRRLAAAGIVLALAVLVGLGSWQLARLSWKRQLIATMDERMAAPIAPVASLVDGDDADYRRSSATGRFDHAHAFFLFALSDSGQGGYHLLEPLRLNDGRALLVDRGWLPYDRREGDRARVFMPDGTVTLAGILRRPVRHWSQPADDPTRNDWYGVDLDRMASRAGISAFLPYVLEVDAAPNPGGYPKGGQTRIALPNNHLGYALTWYGLAVALVVVVAWERRAKRASIRSVSKTSAPA